MLFRKEAIVHRPLVGSRRCLKTQRTFLGSAVLIVFFYGITVLGNVHDPGIVEQLTGTVIAYDYIKAWTPCHKRRCEGSLIMRIDGSDQTQARYIRIDFGYVQGKPPRQLIERKRRWRFKAVRTSNLDEPIYEFIKYEKDAYSEDRNAAIWRFIPGAEGEKLPFGDTLPSYSLVKNGFAPIMKK